ncbi:MAG: hypothetical protein ACC660_02405 [Acidimicrobiales bacterium]
MSIHLPMSIRRSIALFFALTLGFVACGSDDTEGANGELESTAAVETAAESTEAPTADGAESPTESPEPKEPAPAQPAVFDADASELVAEFSPIEPGTQRVTSLGTPFTFTLDEEWWVQPNEPGFFVLSDPASVGPDDRDIVFVRVTGLPDPSATNVSSEGRPEWPLDDIDGWLDNLAEGITITNRQTVNLGDRSAVRFDLRVEDDFECGAEFCMVFVNNGESGGKALNPGVDFRIHWIDEGDSPIVVITGAGLEGAPFFERAEAVMATLAFGEQQPHPIDTEGPLWEAGLDADVPAGRADFFVAGVSVELAEERQVRQNDGWVGVFQRTPSGIFILKPISDLDGNPLATSDAVAEALVADPTAGATEVDVSAEAAYPIREFETVPNSGTTFGLKWNDKTGRNNEWHTGQFTRLWIIDTPDGVVFVSAESAEESAFEGAVTEALGIIATLQSIPAG